MTRLFVALCVFLLTLFGSFWCSTCGGASDTPSSLLRRQLMCGYDKNQRPVLNKQDAVQLTILLWLSYIQIDEYSDSIDIFAWTILNWEDEFLKWDPLKYNNETGFSIHPSTIWTPTLAAARENSFMGAAPVLYRSQMLCMVKSSGLLHCAWPTMYRSPCKSDDRLWPFNTKNCQVFIDQWDDGEGKVNMTLHKYKLIAALWSKGTWELIRYNASMTSVTSELSVIHRVVYSFFLRRRWTIMTTLVFTSTFCAICLTLTPFFIHHLRRGRLAVAIGAIVLHVWTLQTLGYLIDHTLVGLPLIVIFFRDSLIMASISLVLTVFWTIPVPEVARVFPVVKTNKALDKYLTIFRLKVKGGEQKMDEEKSFESIIRVVDVICLLVFVILYVVLCAKFIP